MVHLIDVHSHFVTTDYVAGARAAGVVHPDGMPDWPQWDEQAHLADLDRWDIGHAILSISSPGTHFGDDAAARELTRSVNDAAAGIVSRHPDRFGHFASLPLPDVDGALAELARALDDLGSDGVTVLSNARGRYPTDPAFEPVWAELDRRGATVFMHPTSPVHTDMALGRPRPMLEFLFDTTRAVGELALGGLLTRYPNISWIIPHCGATLPVLADRIELLRGMLALDGDGDGDGADTAAPIPEQLRGLWFDLAGTPFPHHAPALVAAFGDEHVLYGSDYCWTPAPVVAGHVASIDEATQPAGSSWRELTTGNATRLFPRLTATAGRA